MQLEPETAHSEQGEIQVTQLFDVVSPKEPAEQVETHWLFWKNKGLVQVSQVVPDVQVLQVIMQLRQEPLRT